MKRQSFKKLEQNCVDLFAYVQKLDIVWSKFHAFCRSVLSSARRPLLIGAPTSIPVQGAFALFAPAGLRHWARTPWGPLWVAHCTLAPAANSWIRHCPTLSQVLSTSFSFLRQYYLIAPLRLNVQKLFVCIRPRTCAVAQQKSDIHNYTIRKSWYLRRRSLLHETFGRNLLINGRSEFHVGLRTMWHPALTMSLHCLLSPF